VWTRLDRAGGGVGARRGLQREATRAAGEGWRLGAAVDRVSAVLPQLIFGSAVGKTRAAAKMAGWTRLELATSGVTGRNRSFLPLGASRRQGATEGDKGRSTRCRCSA
jgi:hypothetical protein